MLCVSVLSFAGWLVGMFFALVIVVIVCFECDGWFVVCVFVWLA